MSFSNADTRRFFGFVKRSGSPKLYDNQRFSLLTFADFGFRAHKSILDISRVCKNQ